MQQLLAKIRQSTAANKCALAAEAHAQLDQALSNLQPLLDSTPAKDLNLEVFDKTIDEFEEVLEALELLLVGLTTAEAKKIKQTLDQDYDNSIQTLTFYDLLNPDGRSYTGDYAEFTDQKFPLPTKPEILSRLTPQHLKLYQKMEQQGLQPKLQITPIAFQIRTLGKKLDAKKEGQINTKDTFVLNELKDSDLQYSPTSITASPDGKEIQITGGQEVHDVPLYIAARGLTKSQWIKAHGGFLIDIVSMKPELDADLEIQKAEDGITTNYTAIQAEKYASKLKEDGFTSMSFETYLLAQMQAIKAGNPLDAASWSALFGSNLNGSQQIAVGNWRGGYVALSRSGAGTPSVGLRLRASLNLS